ncbi:MAG: hypothetical protein AAGF12_38670 [Myxococcota bacterium]
MRAWACACLVSLLAGTVSAQDRGQAVVVGPLDAALEGRLRGQTADLDWDLERRTGPVPTDPLALDVDARVAIWFERRGASIRVSVADLERRRLLVEEVRVPPGEVLRESTLLETAAFLVRSTLEALSEGGEIGVAVPQVEPATEPGPSFWASVFGLGHFDGADPSAGIGATLGLRLGRIRLGLSGSFGVPRQLDIGNTVVETSRYGVAALAGIRVLAGWIAIDVDVTLGVSILRRTGVSTEAPFVLSRAQTSAAPVGGVHVRGAVFLVDALAIGPILGVEVTRPVRLEVVRGVETQDEKTLWPLGVYVGIELRVESQ